MADERDDEDLNELRALIERTRPADVVWEPAPEAVWDRIAATIAQEPSPEASAEEEPVAPVVPMAGRRRAWWVGVGVAAAAAVVVAFVAVAITGRGDDADVVASVELEQLGDSGSGRADLLDRDGTFQVRLETEGLDPADGYLELWLIDPTVTRLVSLGPLRADGLYDVPAGVDPAAFPIVDVSVEPVDGDPTHSGDSVLRGELTL